MSSSPQFHNERCWDAVDYTKLLEGPWELEYRQLSPGSFTASNIGFKLGSSVVYEESFNRCVSVHGTLQTGLLGFSLPNELARVRGRWWGARYPNSAISFATGGREIDVTFPRGYRNLLILVPEEEFRECYRETTGEEARFLAHAFPHLPVDPASYSKCRTTLKKLFSMPACWNPPQDAIVSIVVDTLANGMQTTSNRTRRTSGRLRSRVVWEAIELWRDSSYRLSVRELSQLVGVSQRTLEHGFRDHFDLTPYQYMSRFRLGLAREALRLADPADSTVSDIAVHHGFWELGRFAGEYRRFFGELPSATLSRASVAPPKAIFAQ
jgi:AraC family ethanolamine operon transcriptional activator